VIAARTDRAADAALASLAGGLAQRTLDVEEQLVGLLARLEVNLDFSEDVSAVGHAEIGAQLAACRETLDNLRCLAPLGRRLRHGASVVLVGRPNVGKSSIFNALLEDDRAIVSATPGTTRDWLESWLELGGVPVRLVDTAGARATLEAREAEGVRRAHRQETDADLRIVVLDATCGIAADDDAVLARTSTLPRVVVWNKTDIASASEDRVADAVAVSARTGVGVAALRARIGELLSGGVGREPAEEILPNERHEEVLRRACESLALASRSWEEGRTEELLAGDVRDAVAALGEITGKSVGEAVLDRIFSRFCIGK
jgi:tRNA modification GTPase